MLLGLEFEDAVEFSAQIDDGEKKSSQIKNWLDLYIMKI